MERKRAESPRRWVSVPDEMAVEAWDKPSPEVIEKFWRVEAKLNHYGKSYKDFGDVDLRTITRRTMTALLSKMGAEMFNSRMRAHERSKGNV